MKMMVPEWKDAVDKWGEVGYWLEDFLEEEVQPPVSLRPSLSLSISFSPSCYARASLTGPRKALRGGISKSIFQGPCQFLAINVHKMAPRTT